MRLLIFLFFFFLSLNQANAQIGISTSRAFNDIVEWDVKYFSPFKKVRNNPEIFQESFGINLGYLFRFKNKRIDFYPNIELQWTNQEWFNSSSVLNDVENSHFSLNQISLNFLTRIYPFDFKGTNQPVVVAKKSGFLKKGLYIIINPSVTMLNTGFTITDADFTNFPFQKKYSTFHPRYGLGLGFDLAMNRFLVISPFAIYSQVPNVSNQIIVDHFNEVCVGCSGTTIEKETTAFNQFQVGINILFDNFLFRKRRSSRQE